MLEKTARDSNNTKFLKKHTESCYVSNQALCLLYLLSNIGISSVTIHWVLFVNWLGHSMSHLGQYLTYLSSSESKQLKWVRMLSVELTSCTGAVDIMGRDRAWRPQFASWASTEYLNQHRSAMIPVLPFSTGSDDCYRRIRKPLPSFPFSAC